MNGNTSLLLNLYILTKKPNSKLEYRNFGLEYRNFNIDLNLIF